MSEEHIVRRKRSEKRKGQTNWAKLNKQSDEDIARAVANDPDAVPLDIDWSEATLVIPQKKKAVSIRLDEDVLEFFKQSGRGYQTRINAVLRSYMKHEKEDA